MEGKQEEEKQRQGRERESASQPYSQAQIQGMYEEKQKLENSASLAVELIKQELMRTYYVSGLHKMFKCVSLRKRTLIYENSHVLIWISYSHIEHTTVLL